MLGSDSMVRPVRNAGFGHGQSWRGPASLGLSLPPFAPGSAVAKRFGIVRLLLLAIALAGLASTALADDEAPSGSQVYARYCADCHGAQRQGTARGSALSVQDYRYGGRREELERVIRNGVVSRGMPAFADSLSAEAITSLVAFLPARDVEPEPEAETETTQAEAEPPRREFDAVPGTVETLDYVVRLERIAEGLDTPWAIAFIDAETALVTERIGGLRILRNGNLQAQPVTGIPEVLVNEHIWNQGGLLDVAIDPDHASNGWVYLSYSHRHDQETADGEALGMTRVIRGRIRENAWVDQQVLFEAPLADYGMPFWHYGGRMVFDREGRLHFSIGDRGAQEQAREPGRANGKIHRILPDGRAPADNPFRGDGELPSVFSLGHRNPQGLTIDRASDRIWSTEHGPRGGDELNVIRRGGDYGWPVVSHGINYDGTVLTPDTRAEGVEQPAFFWRPSIGVSGVAFYDGDAFPLWRGKLLVTGLATRDLRLLTVDGERVQHEEILVRLEGRSYEPVVGPDGAIYLVTDDPGQLLRLTAVQERRL